MRERKREKEEERGGRAQCLKLIYKRACIRACYFEVTERNLAVSSHCKRVSIHFDNVQPRFTRRSSSFRSSARFVQATPGSCNSKCMHLERPLPRGCARLRNTEREKEKREMRAWCGTMASTSTSTTTATTTTTTRESHLRLNFKFSPTDERFSDDGV